MNKRKRIILIVIVAILTLCIVIGLIVRNRNSGSSTATTTNETEVTDSMAGFLDSDEYTDYANTTYTSVKLSSSVITIEGSGVSYSGTDIIIDQPGTYVFSGTLDQGSITVETTKTSEVRIILNSASLTNAKGPAILVKSAKQVMVSLVPGTTNSLNDGSTYTLTGEDDPNAVIYSKTDLIFNGSGTLSISANYNDAIHSTDQLRIIEGTYVIKSVDDGIIGKDVLAIKNGTFTIDADGDGLKSTNEEDTTLGYIYLNDGTFTINSGDDGISSVQGLTINNGTYIISTSTSGEGKGIKATATIKINNGNYTITAADDAINSNYDTIINNGTFKISSGDDGIHSDHTTTIVDGAIRINTSVEGIEGAIVKIQGGTIQIWASDDGINGAGGDDTTTTEVQSILDQYSASSTGNNQGMMASDSTGYIFIDGGDIYVNANGDGIDANNAIIQTAGKIIVEGPTNSGNGALDYGTAYVMTGGTVLAAGSSGMASTISSNSTCYCLSVTYSQTQAVGSVYKLVDPDGNVLIEYTSTKQFQNVVYASSDLTSGVEYTLMNEDGVMMTGTLSSIITSISDTGGAVTNNGGMGMQKDNR